MLCALKDHLDLLHRYLLQQGGSPSQEYFPFQPATPATPPLVLPLEALPCRIPCNPHTTLPSRLPRLADTPTPIVQIVDDNTFFGNGDLCPLVAQYDRYAP